MGWQQSSVKSSSGEEVSAVGYVVGKGEGKEERERGSWGSGGFRIGVHAGVVVWRKRQSKQAPARALSNEMGTGGAGKGLRGSRHVGLQQC